MARQILTHLLAVNLRSSLAQRGSFLLRAAMMFFNNLIFFVTWIVLFQKVERLGDWTLNDVCYLFGISALAFGLGYGSLAGYTRIPELVRSGGLDTYLLKPRSVLMQVLASRSEASAWGDVVSGMLLVIWSGYLDLAHAPLFVASALGAAAVFVASGTIYFSIAFWHDHGDDLSFRLWEVTITFSLYPESIFPRFSKIFLYTVFPAAFISFIPSQLVRAPSWEGGILFVAGVAAIVALSRAVFYLGLRHYESGSRWSVHGA